MPSASRIPHLYSVLTAVGLTIMISGSPSAGTGVGKPRYVPLAESKVSVAQAESTSSNAAPSMAAMGSPGTIVGDTWWDYQHNSVCGPQVAVWQDQVMTAWTQGTTNNSGSRQIAWNRVLVTGSPQPLALDNGSSIDILPLGTPLYANGNPIPGFPTGSPNPVPGYVSVGMLPGSGATVVFCHAFPDISLRIDGPDHDGTFFNDGFQPPAPVADGTPLWPKLAVGTASSGAPDTIVHLVAESQAEGLVNRLWYWRGVLIRAGAFGSVTWGTPIKLDSISTLGYAVAADPNSDRVAVVHTKQVSNLPIGTAVQKYNNLVYVESTDAGLTWSAQQSIVANPMQWPAAAGDYVWADVAAVYDDDNNLHVTYVTRNYDGSALDENKVTLWHWSAAGGSSVVQTTYWSNVSLTGNWTSLLSKPSIAFKPAGAGPGAGVADAVLYVIWTQFGPTLTDYSLKNTLIDRTNGEIYYSASSDGGATWSNPVNVTGTMTPGCIPGDCKSENWVTAAARADSGLYLSFVEDTHAGGIAAGEGSWSLSNYRLLALATAAPVPSGRLSVRPMDPPTWGDPYWTNRVIDQSPPATGIPVTATIEVCNLGNSTLDYTAQVMPDNFGPLFVTVNGGLSYVGSIAALEPCEQITIELDPNGFSDTREFVVKITTTPPPALRASHSAAIDTLDLRFRVPGLPICPITMTGDVNLSGTLTSADVIGLVNYVFKSGAVPSPCQAAGDINCSGSVTSADVIALVNYVFKSGAPPCDACTSPLAESCP